jgi:hypothetical protein
MSAHSTHMQMTKNAVVKGQVTCLTLVPVRGHCTACPDSPALCDSLLLHPACDALLLLLPLQVLMVATSHNKLGDSGKPTGLW